MFKPPPPPPRPPAPAAASPLYPRSATNVRTGSTMTMATATTTTSTTTLTPRTVAAPNSFPSGFATPTSTCTPLLSYSPMNVQVASSFDSVAASGVSTAPASTMTSGTTPGGAAGTSTGTGTRFHFRRPPARPSAAGIASGGAGSSPPVTTSSTAIAAAVASGSLVPTTSPLQMSTATFTVGNRSRSTFPSGGRFRLPPPLSSSPRITKLTTTSATTTTPLATVPFTSATAPCITSSISTPVATTPAATVTTTPTTTKATLLMSSRMSPGSLTPRAMMSVSSVFSASPNPATDANASGSGVATSGVASTPTATTVTNVVAPFLPSLAVAPANPSPSTSSNPVAPPLAPRTAEVHQQGPQGQALGVADTVTATSTNISTTAVAATAPKEQKEEEGCWQELVDPSTGRTYYYNANTNATTWEKPVTAEAATHTPPGTTITADATIYGIAETEAAVERATASEMTSQGNPSVVVPVDDNNPAVVAAAAETPNVTYGLASRSSTSADDKLQQTQRQEVSSTNNNNNLNGDALFLPEGWTELTDPSSGKVYYYHSASHVSTRDRPVVRTSASNDGPAPPPPIPPSSPKQDVQAVVHSVAKEERGTVTKESVTRSVDVAVTSIDTTVQEKRIVHEKIQKQQQSTTTVEANQDGNDRRGNKKSLLAKDIKEEVAGPSSLSRHLPEGWEECFDPSSGQVYYYRASDNLKTWERPVVPAAPPSRRPPPPKQKPIVNKHQSDDDDESFVIVEHPPPPPPVTNQGEVKNEEETIVPPDATNVVALTPTPPPCSGFSAARIEATAAAPIPSRPLPPHSVASRTPLPTVAVVAPRLPLPPATKSTAPPSTAPPSSLSGPPLFVSPFADNHNKIADVDHQLDQVPLPEGWQECQDSSTGRVYYLHERSNTAAWERPTTAAPGNDQVPGQVAFSTDAEESKRETPPSSSSVDVAAADSVTLGGEAVSSDNQPPQLQFLQPLLDGWQECQDSATGQVYYFHDGTCTTTWERPGAGTTIIDQEVETATSANETIAIMDASEEESGRENSVTAASVTDSDEVLTTIVAPASDDAAATESATDLPLPEGWQEHEDPASGPAYYYHEIDGIPTWERPSLVLASIPSEHQEETIVKESKTMHEIEGPSLFAVTPGTEALGFHGDSTARATETFRPDETTTTVAPPPPPAITKEAQEISTAQVADAAEFARGTFAACGNGHDEGWQALQDPSTGQLYYYHEGDNITTWDRPLVNAAENKNRELIKEFAEVEGQDQFDSQDSTKVVVTLRLEIVSSVEEHEPYVDDSPLAAPQKLEDDFNPLLEHPTSRRKSNSNDKVPPPLPEGWQELIDESSGVPFYSHEADGVATWHRPAEKETCGSLVVDEVTSYQDEDEVTPYQDEPVDTLAGDVASGTGEDEFAGETEEKSEAAESSEMSANDQESIGEPHVTTSQQVDVDATRKNSLPDGWEEVVDESSGEVYYFNKAKYISTWDRPQDDVAVDEYKEVEPTIASDGESEGAAVDGEPNTQTLLTSKGPLEGEEVAPDGHSLQRQEALPDGWEGIGPDSGLAYYFHVNDTTRWERPGMESDEGEIVAPSLSTVSTPDASGIDKALVPQKDSDDTDEVDLSSGQVYYYCEAQQISSWERPVGVSDRISLDPSTRKDATRKVIDTGITGREPESPPEETSMSAPTDLQQGRTSTPSSGKKVGFFFVIRNTITKYIIQYLNPNAVLVDLPVDESMQPYYDKERKIWVFPGDDPVEVAKSVGPPPTTPQAVASLTPTTAATATNDPLAAMMAPPKRGPTSLKQKSKLSSATQSRITGMPLPGIGDFKAGPNMVAAPPQFAVFTPSPSATK